jgi:hypothetical protein
VAANNYCAVRNNRENFTSSRKIFAANALDIAGDYNSACIFVKKDGQLFCELMMKNSELLVGC